MSAKIIGAAFLATSALTLTLLAGPVAANDPNENWMRFPGSTYASQSDPSDRAFVKEWESTPPKGYPTLSPANVTATQAAIKRYTTIVAAGGWKSLPDVQLQSGSNHPAVAL